jgi:hypothetical protein
VRGAGHTKVMSTLRTIKFGGEVVHKDRYASIGALSLNGHDSSNIMPAKKAVLKVPTLGRKPTNMPSTDIYPFTNATAGQKKGKPIPSIINDRSTGSCICLRRHIYMSQVLLLYILFFYACRLCFINV